MGKLMKRLAGFIAAFALIAFGAYRAVYTLGLKMNLVILALGAILLFIMTFFTGPDWEDRPWWSKILRVLGIIASCALFSAIIGGALFLINPLGNDEGKPIADFDARVNIWGTIPGNDVVNKTEYMEIDGEPPVPVAAARFEKAITGSEYKDVLNIIDTYTYTHGIQGEYDSILYNDEPFVIPYIAEGSDRAVIIIPGGGYAIRSNEGKDDEGYEIAKALNERGISAFVFWYRANPYPYPIAEMDLQRAVRWVRGHASDYGYKSDQISLLGYGAGGNLACEYINKIMGTTILPESYGQDSVDGVSDEVNGAAMIYPFMNYRKNVPLLFAHYDSEKVRSLTEREALIEETDLTKEVTSTAVRQFVSYGTKDKLIDPQSAIDYIAAARAAGCDITEQAVDEGHYYGQKSYLNEYLSWLNPQAQPEESTPAEGEEGEASEESSEGD